MIPRTGALIQVSHQLNSDGQGPGVPLHWHKRRTNLGHKVKRLLHSVELKKSVRHLTQVRPLIVDTWRKGSTGRGYKPIRLTRFWFDYPRIGVAGAAHHENVVGKGPVDHHRNLTQRGTKVLRMYQPAGLGGAQESF